ncbi:hypothetical protein COUCH_20600 [Couchioplanes caeruleus]|uniref:hypothetical protein n=1 Tax=Couchioplanes caeruleus TaxID=56438 RepID=UPI0020C0B87B|nr:hypothetical protein [Couchioplanes caeruleus]UQU61461.1 hypothetical protein COUCH_20600 [Couchioplanes caeruleus]
MITRTAAAKIVVIGLGVLGCLWVLWFFALMAFGSEGALPPKSRIPAVPAGASVVEQSEQCGSGGCWWQLVLAPAAGQSPADLARRMGLTEEQSLSPELFDPGYVYVGSETRGDRLVVHVGYQ